MDRTIASLLYPVTLIVSHLFVLSIAVLLGSFDRIGQQRDVYVYRFIIKGTVEERIVQLQQKKVALICNEWVYACFALPLAAEMQPLLIHACGLMHCSCLLF